MGPKGDVRCRGILSVVFKTPEMHIPPWYWFSGIDDDYVQDGLSRIAEALEAIGAKQELLEVARLRDRVNPN